MTGGSYGSGGRKRLPTVLRGAPASKLPRGGYKSFHGTQFNRGSTSTRGSSRGRMLRDSQDHRREERRSLDSSHHTSQAHEKRAMNNSSLHYTSQSHEKRSMDNSTSHHIGSSNQQYHESSQAHPGRDRFSPQSFSFSQLRSQEKPTSNYRGSDNDSNNRGNFSRDNGNKSGSERPHRTGDSQYSRRMSNEGVSNSLPRPAGSALDQGSSKLDRKIPHSLLDLSRSSSDPRQSRPKSPRPVDPKPRQTSPRNRINSTPSMQRPRSPDHYLYRSRSPFQTSVRIRSPALTSKATSNTRQRSLIQSSRPRSPGPASKPATSVRRRSPLQSSRPRSPRLESDSVRSSKGRSPTQTSASVQGISSKVTSSRSPTNSRPRSPRPASPRPISMRPRSPHPRVSLSKSPTPRRRSSPARHHRNESEIAKIHRKRDVVLRKSVMNRLGPKLKVSQRLGRVVASRHKPSKQKETSTFNESVPATDKGSEQTQRKLMVLQCPHCDLETITFKDYSLHEKSDVHYQALQKLTETLRYSLGRLRNKQRKDQQVIDAQLAEGCKDVDDKGEKSPSLFCKTCQLMHRQTSAEHEETMLHKAINDFLHPKCQICDTKYRSPIAYAQHIGSLGHIKRKARLGSSYVSPNPSQLSIEETESDGKLAEEENFLTLDEIGEVDEIGDLDFVINEEEITDQENAQSDGENGNAETENGGNSEKGKNEEEKINEDAISTSLVLATEIEVTVGEKMSEKITKNIEKMPEENVEKIVINKLPTKKVQEKKFFVDPNIPIGQSFVRAVEMFYCDLCHKYLPRSTGCGPLDTEKSIETHCLTPSHQSAFQRKRQEEIDAETKALSELEKSHQGQENEEDDTLIIDNQMLIV